MTPDEIENCIEGDVQISSIYVDSGLTNAGERIDGLATEAYLNGEGLSRYDIRTYLKVPGDSGHIKLLVNVEAQNDDRPGYDLSLRALFYCCRMISAQQGVEFTTDRDDPVKYGNIKKGRWTTCVPTGLQWRIKGWRRVCRKAWKKACRKEWRREWRKDCRSLSEV